MQNFKSFLTEQLSVFKIIIFLEYNIFDENIVGFLKNEKNAIQQEIKSKCNLDAKLSIKKDAMRVELALTNYNEQIPKLQQLVNNVVELLEHYNIDDSFEYIHEDTNIDIRAKGSLPTNIPKINFSLIYIQPVDKLSLKGIHNIIGDFEYLQVNGDANISDSVLGLFNLHNPPKSTVSGLFSNTEKWTTIVKKYLDNNGDILECQEELISNGFKEYAKL